MYGSIASSGVGVNFLRGTNRWDPQQLALMEAVVKVTGKSSGTFDVPSFQDKPTFSPTIHSNIA